MTRQSDDSHEPLFRVTNKFRAFLLRRTLLLGRRHSEHGKILPTFLLYILIKFWSKHLAYVLAIGVKFSLGLKLQYV